LLPTLHIEIANKTPTTVRHPDAGLQSCNQALDIRQVLRHDCVERSLSPRHQHTDILRRNFVDDGGRDSVLRHLLKAPGPVLVIHHGHQDMPSPPPAHRTSKRYI